VTFATQAVATQAVPVSFAAQPVQQFQYQQIPAFQTQAVAVQAAPQALAFQAVPQAFPTFTGQAVQQFVTPSTVQSASAQDADLRTLLALAQRLSAADSAKASTVQSQAAGGTNGDCPKACEDRIKSNEARIANLEAAVNKLVANLDSLANSVAKLVPGK